MRAIKSAAWDAPDHCQTAEAVAANLEAAFASGDVALIRQTFGVTEWALAIWMRVRMDACQSDRRLVRICPAH